MKNMCFDDLEPGMKVYDMVSETFGIIQGKVEDDDPFWRMLEVIWETVDGATYSAHCVSGCAIAVVVDSEMKVYEDVMKAVAEDDSIDDLDDEDTFILNIVDEW